MRNFNFSSNSSTRSARSLSLRIASFGTAPRAGSASVRARRFRSPRAGFTVLEVLIAMVVLLIGGLAILNLFPPALNVIRGSENREVAMSQVKGTLAKYESDPATIPDAIYDNSGAVTVANPSGYNDLAISVEGGRNHNNALPQTTTDTNSALDHFKHIVGERHKVLSDASNNRFVLLNYAYIGATTVSVADEIEGARVSSNGVIDFSDAVLSSNNSIANPPPAGFYYVSYAWRNSLGGVLQGVVDEPIAFSATPGAMQVFQGTVLPAFTDGPIVAGPITLKVFSTRTNVPPTGDAPFRGFLPVDSTLAPGQEVVVDYTVRDWRWLIEDTRASVLNPANSAFRDVKLTVPDLNAAITTPLYGLVYQVPNSYNVVATNPGTWSGTTPNGVISSVSRTAVVYDPGTITQPLVRTSYQATHGWAIQPSVAANSYYAYYQARSTTISKPWREYYWNPSEDTMYFRASEAGKTIMVSFTSGGIKVANQIMTIGAKLVPAPLPVSSSGFTAVGGKVAVVRFIDSAGVTPVAADAIQSVRGVSVRARAAWVQSGQYTQEVAEMYRPLN